MYWYSSKHFKLLSSVLLCASGLVACRPDVHESTSENKYFDLKGYVSADISRLARRNAGVTKTVQHNRTGKQTKTISTINWEQELAPFVSSDINKPAWRQSYSTEQKGDSTVYTALQHELNTRRIVIHQQDGHVSQIAIDNATHNLLYNNSERLIWYPDSLYVINKWQKVRLLGENVYEISGVIR
ncbi:hypothetical protein LLH06_06950 [Mucilaginibacter daejeonensis]|uniref:hypothetical protein n=1 Tax=Mucilaginibacter daejeonensis TaxID=398049 RepID=UPI001D179E15|nr:hypothetical protein [Mucilaginibacter daejeonensis]UEG54698.1 hypothetical protein LLH06_06950 [Mucilaginibacter daejeonensis]